MNNCYVLVYGKKGDTHIYSKYYETQTLEEALGQFLASKAEQEEKYEVYGIRLLKEAPISEYVDDWDRIDGDIKKFRESITSAFNAINDISI